ncbi:MAG TPA: N-acetylmuramoyl-L-alanine amidase [Candidatus Sulfotelmatobacter sp.]|nr:N-acetylmuramoyl-L-alanine amidase [Candidatus Sulfotelmatobacter sp.]
MRSAFALLILLVLLAFGLSAGAAQSAARAPEPSPFEEKNYARLADWAKGHNLELCWLKREETLQLSTPSAKVVLGIDSREAHLNGVLVWLAFPLVYHNGAVYIAQLDLQTTLQPLLWPPKGRSGPRIRAVCLDPGHGGKDPGNRVGSKEEKKFTLLLAREVRDQLKRAGLKVLLTRSTDSFVELPNRPELAKRRSADLFVSLHFNAAEHNRESVKGAEVYCLTPPGASSTNARGEAADTAWCAGNRSNERNLLLAYQVQKALTQNLCVEDRGVRRARFAVLREAVMPAVLIEAGFMSHPGEGGKIFTEAYRRQMARAIVEGLLAYKRAVELGG